MSQVVEELWDGLETGGGWTRNGRVLNEKRVSSGEHVNGQNDANT